MAVIKKLEQNVSNESPLMGKSSRFRKTARGRHSNRNGSKLVNFELEIFGRPRLLSQVAAVVIRLKRGCQKGFI